MILSAATRCAAQTISLIVITLEAITANNQDYLISFEMGVGFDTLTFGFDAFGMTLNVISYKAVIE